KMAPKRATRSTPVTTTTAPTATTTTTVTNAQLQAMIDQGVSVLLLDARTQPGNGQLISHCLLLEAGRPPRATPSSYREWSRVPPGAMCKAILKQLAEITTVGEEIGFEKTRTGACYSLVAVVPVVGGWVAKTNGTRSYDVDEGVGIGSPGGVYIGPRLTACMGFDPEEREALEVTVHATGYWSLPITHDPISSGGGNIVWGLQEKKAKKGTSAKRWLELKWPQQLEGYSKEGVQDIPR
ncbi:hypothetical protein Tco_1021705, partial [Tanacetum coccineum]